MRKAAANLDFEKAAQLRDALEDLKRTTLKTEKFERIPYTLPVAVHPESDLRELGRLLGLAAPPARIEGFDISISAAPSSFLRWSVSGTAAPTGPITADSG